MHNNECTSYGWQWVGISSDYSPFDFALDKTRTMFFGRPPLGVGLCRLQFCSDSDSRTSYGVWIIIKLYSYRYYTNDLKGLKTNRLAFPIQLNKENMSFKL